MATIAIIDNDKDTLDVMQLLLEGEGYSVEQFATSKEFLSTFTPGLFKLILTDLSMPDIDGYELLKLVRAQDPKVSVMAVTGRAYDGDRKQAEAAGFSEFVTKPITNLPAVFNLILRHLRAD